MTQYQVDRALLRAVPRIKIFQPGTMLAAGADVRVHLLDVSVAGALLHAAAPPEPGSIVRLTAGETLGAARVVWRRGRRFGVSFAAPIAAGRLDRLIADQVALVQQVAGGEPLR